jgi:quercetin dioxygenase-like cupin family protein
MTAMFRMEPGTSYPQHIHAGAEECYVLEGDLHVGDMVLHAGDYQRAEAGSHHGYQSTETGCVLLVTCALNDEHI